MQKVARFEKVSRAQFTQDWTRLFGPQGAEEAYDAIVLPKRATAGSAGYDFYLPMPLTLEPGQGAPVPTGIRAVMQPGWVLLLFPRSGLGIRHRLTLDNTTGVIDSDYAGAENQGHILVGVRYGQTTGMPLVLDRGRALVQGVFVPFGVAEDDRAEALRTGGFGSTTPSVGQ